MVKCWSIDTFFEEENNESRERPRQLSFSESVKKAVQRLESNLFDIMNSSDHRSFGSPLSEILHQEIKQYFTTGNCGGSATNAACPNPMFLELVTAGQWHVHYAACPFDGYLPLPPWRELTESDQENHGLIFTYCRMELKKLLVSFRQRISDVKFSFYSCDALEFCYQDSPIKFDVIASSDLADVVGLVNVLNAAARKLRSARSILITETVQWNNVAPTVSQYLQEVLCCPMSLIPTIYGLRLMDDIELGSDTPPKKKTQTVLPCRIRWKKVPPFDGVPLVLSPTLERSLNLLREECFWLSSSSVIRSDKTVKRCGMNCYSPLTFRYVVSDLIRRGGFQDSAALLSSALCRLPPVFTKSLETNQAWIDRRPVWRVKLGVPYKLIVDDYAVESTYLVGVPVLRLILVPVEDFNSVMGKCQRFPDDAKKYQKEFYKLDSVENHFFDNLEVNFKRNSDGAVDHVEVSFLLHDRSLLETHCFLVTSAQHFMSYFPGIPMPPIPPSLHSRLQSFKLKWPFPLKNPPNSLPIEQPRNKSQPILVAESCKESEGDFSIRFKIHQQSTANQKPPKGKINLTTQ